MRTWLTTVVLATTLLAAGSAFAQAASPAADASAVSAAVHSQNIFDVKREASADPNYANQSNGERSAVQPGNNAPMWRQVGNGASGYSSLPRSQAPEAGTLIQGSVQYPGMRSTNAGEAWRQVRNNWLIPYGAALLFVTLLALVIFYFARGPITLHSSETGRKIERFTPFERATHWSNAIAFVVLALSGIVIAFGKFFLLPVLGASLFGWLTYGLKNIHNFVGPLFIVTTLFMVVTFIRSNWPKMHDIGWLMKGGGMFGGHEPPSDRFNAGEKTVFWGGVLFLGSIVIASGMFLDKLVPGVVYVRGDMQIAHMIHAAAALMAMVMIMAHIYLGTVGMHGAYKAMRTGYVDETWAREHHKLWYDDIVAGKIPAQRSGAPNPSARPVRAEGTST